MVAGKDKLGIHLLMRNVNYNDVLALLAARHRNGNPIPFITVVGPEELSIRAIKGASPLTRVALRVWRQTDGSLAMTPAAYFAQYIEPVPDRLFADYHLVNNEVNDFSPDTISWWRMALIWAEKYGYKLACPTWATGNPGDLFVWQRADILDLLRAIRNGGHLLSLHEYFRSDGTWELGRFVSHVYPTLPADLKADMPNVAFTEFGEQGARDWSPDLLWARMQAWRGVLDYPWIIGASMWTCGDTGSGVSESWEGDNYANKLSVLQNVRG